jgi:hypothetical protein
LVVDLYARGVVRAAVDEGARAGAAVDADAAACEQRARDVLRNLLGGPMGRAVQLECRDADGRMQAVASVELPSWIPSVVPGWAFAIVGSATKERAP